MIDIPATPIILTTSAILLIPLLLHILTPRPLPGIPYRHNLQFPLIGDALDAGKWLAQRKSIGEWTDGCVRALIYGGPDAFAKWGILRKGGKSAEQFLDEKGGERWAGYEGICQMLFGLGNGARQVVVTDLEEIQRILTSRTAEFDRAESKMESPSMTSKNLAAVYGCTVRAANKLVELWMLKAAVLEDGQFFESAADFSCFSSDVITDMAFGKSYNSLEDQIARFSASPTRHALAAPFGEVKFPYAPPEICGATERLIASIPLFSPFPRISNLIQRCSPSWRRNRACFYAYAKEQIAAGRERLRLAAMEGRVGDAECLLDHAMMREQEGDGLPDDEIRDEMLSIILAAGETTAGTMCWAVKFLARHPGVQRKLRSELQDAGLDEREMLYQDLSPEKLPYLEATAREILRLCGIIGGPVRNAVRDTTILGKAIPKGTLIYIPTHLVATLPLKDTAQDPDSVAHLDDRWVKYPLGVFAPERWLRDARFDEEAGEQVMPFSAGPRGCFGKPLAMLEIKTMLAKLNLAFFLEPIPAELDTFRRVQHLSEQPAMSYVRLANW